MFTQMIFRIVLCCVAGLATLLSFRFFHNVYTNDKAWDFVRGVSDLNLDFLKYYTNISNWMVFGVSVAVLTDNVKRVRAGEKYGHNRVAPALKFMTTVMIAVTFLVYSTMLENPFTIRYWRNLYNLSCHVFSPVLFVLDYLLFDEHRTVKFYYPLLGLVFPLIYFFYILLLGACIPDFKYPYFFLDVNKYGYAAVGLGVLAFVAGFLIIGYLLWLYDKIVKVNGKWKLDFSPVRAAALPA